MSGRREFDQASDKRGLHLERFAFFHVLVSVGLLMAWTVLFGYLADEVSATSRAAKGDGVSGTFTAHTLVCARRDCSWYGTFTTASLFGATVEGVELRGDDGHSFDAGEMVSALDVGSEDFVQMRGGSPEWGLSFGAGFFSAITGGLASGMAAVVLWDVYWTRASPEARRRQARERGRPTLRDLADPDRWGWPARPGSSAARVKLARSGKGTLTATIGLLSLAGAMLLFGLIWDALHDETSRAELIAGLWAPLFAIILVGVTIQTLRLILVRPRMWVTDDEIVIWDGLLLWKVLRIPRTAIAAIHYGDGPRRYPLEEDVAALTPFREELNLALEMRDTISLPARRLRWGNWFWIMLVLKNHVPRTGMPQRGHLVQRLCLRVKEPRRAATDLDRWLGGATPSPPEFAPVDHAHYGMVRTHSGVGDKRIKLKGQLPQPILAEFVNEGPGTLQAWLRRTEFGHGPPVMVCGPKAPPATTVLDDRLVSDKPLTKRFLSVESEGPWTVTISGPERAREFTGSATGSGPEVLAYRGPAGIAVLTSAGRQSHRIHLHDANLTALNNGDPIVSTTALPGADPPPTRSTFAVPAQAVLQVATAGTEWRLDVTPLEQADADTLVQDAITTPPTGHVRPFEHAITGHNTAVVRYLGPPGPVLFHSRYAFGLLQLDSNLTPLRPLALPSGNQKLRLRSNTLLQVTGGEGTWSLEEAHLHRRGPY